MILICSLGMTVQDLYDYTAEFGEKETDSFRNMDFKYADGDVREWGSQNWEEKSA